MSDPFDRDDFDRDDDDRDFPPPRRQGDAAPAGRRESDPEKRRKERKNERFQREELGELLKLFSSLGITMAFGIVAFFLAGMWVDRQLTGMGHPTRGAGRIVFLLAGLGMSVYWSYLRIARHLKKFDAKDRDGKDQPPEDPGKK